MTYKYVKIAGIIFLLGLLFGKLTGCAHGSAGKTNLETRTFTVENFSKIELEGAYHVVLAQGDTPELRIDAFKDDFDRIDVYSDQEAQKLGIKQHSFSLNQTTLYITFSQLNELSIKGGAQVSSHGYLDVSSLELKVAGGAKMELKVKAEKVLFSSEGGVIAELKGVAESLQAKITGAGHLSADELETRHTQVQLEGLGTAAVFATQTLNAQIHGVGKIRYKGDPAITKQINGLGTLTKQ